jgi:hypothetical protein
MQRSPSDREEQGHYPQEPEPDHGLAYFVPGQVVLLAEHEPNDSPDSIIDQVKRELVALKGDQTKYLPRAADSLIAAVERLHSIWRRKPGVVLTFSRTNPDDSQLGPRWFSQILVDEVIVSDDERTSERQLIEALDFFNRRIITDRRRPGPLQLSVLSPNWFAACAQPGITGGPGAPPIPVPEVPASGIISALTASAETTAINLWEFALPTRLAQSRLQTEQQGYQDIEVAILDTAPQPEVFKDARKHNLHQKHPLLQAMLQPDGMPLEGPPASPASAGKLSISYAQASQIDLGFPHRYKIKDHAYTMPDHGLFVAGIVNSIAPHAKLHLIEVLDSHGIGTLQGLSQALHTLVNRSDIHQLVINCSLMINMPLLGHPRKNLDWDALAEDCELIRRMSQLVQLIRDELSTKYGARMHMVAAAGNDAKRGHRPQARLPAALDGVIGVGAGGPHGGHAEYSNLSDTPLGAGLVTFGGQAHNDQTDPATGMLGVFISPLPSTNGAGLEPNGAGLEPNGWARWAGTSFAAPVISGTLAMLVDKGIAKDFVEAEQLIRQADAAQTQEDEEIFMVQQGVARTNARGAPV